MTEREPQINPENEPGEEKEQTPEEILFAIELAAENKSEARLTVVRLDGKSFSTAIVSPVALGGDILWITTEKGEGIPIERNRIKKAKLPSGPEE